MKPLLARATTTLALTLALAGCFDSKVIPGRGDHAAFCTPESNECVAPSASIDLNADACADRCEAPSCETFAPVICAGGAMPVDSDGDGCARECPPSDSDFCGGIAGIGCDAGEYCDFPLETSCGSGDQAGKCLPTPEACTALYAPVCGCDGVTYGNECEAHGKGVSVRSWGPCEVDCAAIECSTGTHPVDSNGDGCDDGCVTDGRSCGGLVPGGVVNWCEADQYCDYAPSAICGAADATGTCQPRPGACTREYAPVCGCDAKDYGNACEAHAHGTSVAHEGKCNVACPLFYPDCRPGYEPVDANHDGCLDGCGPSL